MKLFFPLLILIIFVSINTTLFAQEESMTAAAALRQADIKTQFETVIKKSGRYQEYKVVKREWMDKLMTNTLDSIKVIESKLATSNATIKEQQSNISNLKASLDETNNNLTSVTSEKDNMQFMGASMTKGTYKTMMWSIVGILLILLGFFIYKFKNSNTVTVEAKKSLAEIEAEFEDHRRRALEREQKVMRKLQDELNKQRKAGS